MKQANTIWALKVERSAGACFWSFLPPTVRAVWYEDEKDKNYFEFGRGKWKDRREHAIGVFTTCTVRAKYVCIRPPKRQQQEGSVGRAKIWRRSSSFFII
jgi:hypothetical protein